MGRARENLGNDLTVSYASYNKPTSITRGTTTIGFSHDPEQQRFQQTAPGGTTLYLGSAEKFTGSGGAVRWTNYLMTAGGLVGVHVENSEETTSTRYFHKDHLGSIAVITDEAGAVVERLSYDAWGKRRNPNGTDDPAGSITSQTNRGFTGHEELDSVGLVHMNGRVYDPLLARFGTADPMTESPFSTQGWNRYSYVGNSPLNFTDPSGYCFLGCFWQGLFKGIQKVFRAVPILGTLLQIAAGAICGPACAILVSAFVAGVTSGSLGAALKAGFITAVSFGVMQLGSELLGFGGAAAAGGGSGASAPATYVVEGSYVPTMSSDYSGGQLAGPLDGTSVPPPPGPPPVVPPTAVVPLPVPGPSIGQSLLQGMINLIPGAYLSGQAIQQYRAGNYGAAAAYGGLAVGDFLLGVAPLGMAVRGGMLLGRGLAAGEAGRFGDLAKRAIVGDKLTPHHMPQAAAGYTARADGGALVMNEAEHVLTRTYGFKGALTAEQEAGMAFRDVLARDIRDVRGITGSTYNEGLRDLLGYYRRNFPELMAK
jgi:RHS repeat-associated protein